MTCPRSPVPSNPSQHLGFSSQLTGPLAKYMDTEHVCVGIVCICERVHCYIFLYGSVYCMCEYL